MIRNLIRKLFPKPQPSTPARVPDGVTVYAIGDLHGELGLLEKMLDVIRMDAAGPGSEERIVVVFLGDYIDRGPNSRGVVELLLTRPVSGAEHRFLKGNHEQVLLDYLANPETAAGWLGHGGLMTIDSYGIRHPLPTTAEARASLREALAAAMPPAHKAFFERLELRADYGDYVFAHAGIDPRRPMQDQDMDSLLWIREPFLSWNGPLAKRIVHGHTVRPTPEVLPHRIGLDTGAYANGTLSAAALSGSRVRILQATR